MLLCQDFVFSGSTEDPFTSTSRRKVWKDTNINSIRFSRHGIPTQNGTACSVLSGKTLSVGIASPACRLVSPLLAVKCDDKSTVVEPERCNGQTAELCNELADIKKDNLVCNSVKQEEGGSEGNQGLGIDNEISIITDKLTDRIRVEPHSAASYTVNKFRIQSENSIEQVVDKQLADNSCLIDASEEPDVNGTIQEATDDKAVVLSVDAPSLLSNVNGASSHNNAKFQTENKKEKDLCLQEFAEPQASTTDKEFLQQLASKIECADSLCDVLSSETFPAGFDFNIILDGLQSSEKIITLCKWLINKNTANSNAGVYNTVFTVLGKRHEWNAMDSFLTEMLSNSPAEIDCSIFNALLYVCDTFESPDWATKWFQKMMEESVQPNVTTFKTLMVLYQRHNMFKEAEFTYFSMVSVGVKCYRAALIMMKFYFSISQFSKMSQIFFRIFEGNPSPQLEFFTLLLDSYVEQGKVRESEELIKYILDSGYAVGVAAYNSMITVNGKSGYFYSARAWFDKIKEDGLKPNRVTYRSLIGACGRAGKYHEAFKYYEEMKLHGFSPNLANFNTLIHLHRKVDTYGRIFDILSHMKEVGCCPGPSTLHSVLKVYERYARLSDLPDVLSHFQETGWRPTAKCFGYLIRTYIRHNMVEQALGVFNDLCSVDKPEEIMCHNLIHMCKSTGHYDEAIYVFEQMQKFIQPSLMTSCTMINIYSLKGAIKDAESIIESLKLSGKVLDPVTYNVFLTMYLKEGMLEKAVNTLKIIMEQKDFHPDAYLLLSMLRVCAKCDLKMDALDIYWMIVHSKVTWTEPLYSGVIHTCGRDLPLVEVMNMFDAMVSARMPINTLTCNVLIDIFGKAGLLDKANEVLKVAQKLGVHDCISYSTIIDAYGKNKEFSNMKLAFIEMRNQGFKGCVEAYNAMIDAYGMSGQIDQMEHTFQRMEMVGCQPRQSTFNTLIKIYGQEGLMEDLKRVLQDMKERNMNPDAYTYNSLMFAYGNSEMLDEALNWFMEMLGAGYTPDKITYNILVTALGKGGYAHDATRLSTWIADTFL